MACAWFAAGALILANGLHNLNTNSTLEMTLVIGSLVAVAVGVPAYRGEQFRNPASLFFLVVGAVLICALAALATVAYFLFLFINSPMTSHG